MSIIRKVNVSEIDGPFYLTDLALPNGTLAIHRAFDEVKEELRLHDGVTPGGNPVGDPPAISNVYGNLSSCYQLSAGTGGYNNIFFGNIAGASNTSGCSNNFFGPESGYQNTVGCSNNFFGEAAGACNVSGNNNNFLGYRAGNNNTTASGNNFIGGESGRFNTTGCYNSFLGYRTGFWHSTGNFNTFLGYRAGAVNSSGSNNILIGCEAGSAVGGIQITTVSNRIVLGNTAHTCAEIQIPWTVVSDERDKCIFGSVQKGRGFLQGITPIEYAFKDRTTGCLTDVPGKKRYGFSAQNVLAQEGEDLVIVSADNPDKLQITSDYLIPVLVNAVNELSQEIEQLKQRLINLESK